MRKEKKEVNKYFNGIGQVGPVRHFLSNGVKIVLLLGFILNMNPKAFAEVTFGTNVRVDNTGSSTSNQLYSSIAVDLNGNVYVSWMDARNGNVDIYFARSTDGGNSFGTNIRVDDTGSPASSQRRPSIAVDTNGNIYVAWMDTRNGTDDIYFAKSVDGGSSFAKSIRVDDTGSSASSQQRSSIAVDTNGNIYVAWMDTRNGSYDIYFARSTDGGNSFGTNIRVDDTGSSSSHQRSPSIAADPNGNVYVAWQDERNSDYPDIYFAKSTDGGNSFGINIRVDDTGSSTSEQYQPSIAADPNGDIYVAWYDYRNRNADIYFAKSTDGGNSFVTNVRVDDTGSSTSYQLYPSIALYTNGNIYVAWQDERNSDYPDIYFAKSTDRGTSFGINIRVDDTGSSTSPQYQPSIAAEPNGNIYVAWMDTRNGNYDIYSAKSIELTLLTPNGGESILKGTTYEIRWRSNYSVDNVLIEYSLNNGQNWGPVEACNVGSTGSYFWSVPDVISEECLVRISYSNHLNVSDTSDIAFEISDCSFKGDLSGDCFVDFLDLAFLAGNWLKSGLRRIFYFNLNEDPNWTKEGQWQFGQPAGAGGIYGKPDPNSGYTGNNVYGVNLNGDYSTAAGGPYYLTIGPLDCSQYSNVKLKFYRWLNTDIPDYVSSRIEVSNNGADWVNIWEHTGSSDIADDTWQFKEYDISSAADGKSTIYIRWGYEILDEHAFSYSGWNIDDVQLLGTR